MPKRALAAVLLLSSSAFAGGGGNLPESFNGAASPVVPPTACRGVLPPPRRVPHGSDYGRFATSQPLQVASCWRGRLKGRPFTLTGYGSTGAEDAVVVEYRGKRTLLNLGMGSPTVTRFTGSFACYVPALSKGVVYPVDIERGQLYTGDAFSLCRPEEAVSHPERAVVSGLERSYRVGYGVRPLP